MVPGRFYSLLAGVVEQVPLSASNTTPYIPNDFKSCKITEINGDLNKQGSSLGCQLQSGWKGTHVKAVGDEEGVCAVTSVLYQLPPQALQRIKRGKQGVCMGQATEKKW